MDKPPFATTNWHPPSLQPETSHGQFQSTLESGFPPQRFPLTSSTIMQPPQHQQHVPGILGPAPLMTSAQTGSTPLNLPSAPGGNQNHTPRNSFLAGFPGNSAQAPPLGLEASVNKERTQFIAQPVAYPRPQFQSSSQPAPAVAGQNVARGTEAQNANNKQRVFTGSVMKLHDSFGFVDDDVFFSYSVVKGPRPKLGDKVLVEASYNHNMPFKWNASRVQALPVQSNTESSGFGSQSSSSLSHSWVRDAMDGGKRERFAVDRARDEGLDHRRGGDASRGRPREKRERRDVGRRDRSLEGKRDEPDEARRSRNITRSRSPRPSDEKREERSPRRVKPSPRYSVQIPKISTAVKIANVVALRARYPNLYIPSDFISAQISWSSAFEIDSPFPLVQKKTPLGFNVFSKDAEAPTSSSGAVDPSDANHEFVAKVMLLALPTFDALCEKVLSSGREKEDVKHPTRCLEFLVGTKNRNELAAIGGPWSPSLDGLDPLGNPKVLVKTAIRNTKALTGIDLSLCKKWYKFVQLHYYRPEETYKGTVIPAHLETVVVFLPDIWNAEIDKEIWERTIASYRKIGNEKVETLQKRAIEKAASGPVGTSLDSSADCPGEQPKHWSELDPKKMKISELRQQLRLRNVSETGLKSLLIAKMQKAIKAEQEQDDIAGEMEDREREKFGSEIMNHDKEDLKTSLQNDIQLNKDVQRLEKMYYLPHVPQLLVHPSQTAKSGKFDCSLMSLSVLLDYRHEDQKESSFEVSLFAELFNEMLLRDFGLKIYRELTLKSSGEDRVPPEEKCADPLLAIAFVYFDLNRCGYLYEKDLSDIFETLGLSLSRSQIKQVSKNFVEKDKIIYESITGKYEGEANVLESESSSDVMGNVDLLMSIKEKEKEKSAPRNVGPEGRSSPGAMQDVEEVLSNPLADPSTSSSSSTLVVFRGSVVDLDKISGQLADVEADICALDEVVKNSESEIQIVKNRKQELQDSLRKDAIEMERLQAAYDASAADLHVQQTKVSAFTNVLQCQRDALAKGVEIIEKTLKKYDAPNEENGKSQSVETSEEDT